MTGSYAAHLIIYKRYIDDFYIAWNVKEDVLTDSLNFCRLHDQITSTLEKDKKVNCHS